MEVEVIRPMWFNGQQLGPGAEGEPNPVVDMPGADAVYLEGLGRVRRIEAQAPAEVLEIVSDESGSAEAAGADTLFPETAKPKKAKGE